MLEGTVIGLAGLVLQGARAMEINCSEELKHNEPTAVRWHLIIVE